MVILQAGNINSGACDPFAAVADRAQGTGAWVHIDGAFGLWARASAATRAMTEGMERADSWSVDGHKWLNLPQDSAVYMCRDAEAVDDVFGVTRDLSRQGRSAASPAQYAHPRTQPPCAGCRVLGSARASGSLGG